ncbi:MAG: hypothetical protein HPY66_3011 [Firmicutes bacterium]|nr:hypothetical protein [Bacillota bacterium]
MATFDPEDETTGVSVNVEPVISFDESVYKTDGSTITGNDLASLVTLRKDDVNGDGVGFTADIDGDKKVITITPSAPLEYSQTYYMVQMKHGSGEWTQVGTPTTNSFTKTGLASSATYVFRAMAVDEAGNESDWSGECSVTTNSSSSGSSRTTIPKKSIITDVAETGGDKLLDKALIYTGKALLSLSGGKSSAEISPAVIGRLAQHKEPFTVENTVVRLEFDHRSLDVEQVTGAGSGAAVVVGAREVTGSEKQRILAETPPGQSSGLFEIGGRIFGLTALVKAGDGNIEKIEELGKPVAVTIDLSHLGELTDEQIGQLTGIRLEKDEQGNVVPVSLGGSYDPDTKTFTFYTDRFSLYTVMRQRLAIVLTIGSMESRVNGKPLSLDVPPSIIDDRTMVPARFVAESMGADVEWNGKTSTVRITLGEKVLNLVIGQRDEAAGLDVPARIVEGRTMVPVRYISEALGASVNWLPETRSVEIVK